MRVLTDHKLGVLNEAIEIQVLDEPGAGGACHRYRVHVPLKDPAEKFPQENSIRARAHCTINFQKGSTNEAGLNGISNEALLVVLIDRLRGFQSGPFASSDNEMALVSLDAALCCLQKRTRERIDRGVEDTHEK